MHTNITPTPNMDPSLGAKAEFLNIRNFDDQNSGLQSSCLAGLPLFGAK